MASARFAWGIDVGNRALKAVKLVRDPAGQLKIDDFEIIEHETVLSNAGDNRESLIQASLANFIQRHPMKGGGAIALGVSGQSSFARFIKLPPVEPAKIPEIVRFEAIQQIPFPLDDVEWSYQLFQDAQSPDVEVGIFAMRKELVANWLQYFTDIDLSVHVVQMNPLAVYNAMHYEQRLTGTTMTIDMGAENTDLIISEGETIWLRSIPIGGNNFTEALVKAFKLNFPKAEELKRNAPSSKFAKQIFQAMRPIFADLVSEIQRSIGFYASVHRESRINKVLALGGTFRLPGLLKYLQQNLQLDVEAVKSLAIGQPSDAKLAAAYNENLLSVASAYGLAVQAMGDSKISSSLLPEKIRRERLWREKTKWFGLAAACFVFGAGIGYTRYFYEDFRMTVSGQNHQQKINQIQNQAKDLDAKWSEIETRGGPDRNKITAIRSLESSRTLWSQILNEITSTIPTPQPELVDRDAKKMKAIPRGERKILQIDQITTQYKPSIIPIVNDSEFKRFISEGAQLTMLTPVIDPAMLQDPAAMSMTPTEDTSFTNMQLPFSPGKSSDPNAKHGFLITLKVTTPYANAYQLVDQMFVKRLAAPVPAAIAPGKTFYFARAEIVSATRIFQDPTRIAMLTQASQIIMRDRQLMAQAPTGLGTPGAQPALPPDQIHFMDRLLPDEDVRNDWVFTILLAVVIDPPPPPAPATPGAPRASAQ